MQVLPITSNSTIFKGCVNATVENKVDNMMKNAISHSKYLANRDGKLFSSQEENQIRAYYNFALNTLNNKMNLLHPNTELTYINTPNAKREGVFMVTNPLTNKSIEIIDGNSGYGVFNKEKGTLCMQAGSYFDIDFHNIIGRLVDAVNSLDNLIIDTWFYKQAINELKENLSADQSVLKGVIKNIMEYKKQCKINSQETSESLFNDLKNSIEPQNKNI